MPVSLFACLSGAADQLEFQLTYYFYHDADAWTTTTTLTKNNLKLRIRVGTVISYYASSSVMTLSFILSFIRMWQWMDEEGSMFNSDFVIALPLLLLYFPMA